ncbi:hypothetical protein TKK_0016825 [Trichogramma kaykai]
MGPKTSLTEEEEKRIVQWIIDKAAIGYPMRPKIVKESVKKLLISLGGKSSFTSGDKWIKLFIKRYKELKLKNAEVLCKLRAAVTEDMLRQWFIHVDKYCQKEKISDVLKDPKRIFNMDETGVQLCPKTGKVLTLREEKNTYSMSGGAEKQNIIVLCSYSGDGESHTPMIVYPYKKSIPLEVGMSIPEGYAIGKSNNG